MGLNAHFNTTSAKLFEVEARTHQKDKNVIVVNIDADIFQSISLYLNRGQFYQLKKTLELLDDELQLEDLITE